MTLEQQAPAIRPVAFAVDRAFYKDVTRAVDGTGDLDALVTTGLRDHFYGTAGADYWTALCESTEYGHQDLVRSIDAWFPEALRLVLPTVATAGSPIRLVSLGPGTGEIDVRLLSHLERSESPVTYGCVDASFELLRRAVARIANATELRSPFAIDALCADFTQFERDRPHGDIDILTLLGGTLGNYREIDLIERVKDLMTPRTHLLIDAWVWRADSPNGAGTISNEDRRTLMASLNFPARNRFVFGPVEAATTASARDVTFDHDVNQSITVVPGAVNIVTYCVNLHTRMRLTDEEIHRSHLPLAVTTRYDFEQLTDWFGANGLRVEWRKNAGPFGVFLVKRDVTDQAQS
jgi:hypothetical protein